MTVAIDLSLEVDGFYCLFGFETDVDADVDVVYDVGSEYYHFYSISIGFDLMVSLVLFRNTIGLLWRYQCWVHFGWESKRIHI